MNKMLSREEVVELDAILHEGGLADYLGAHEAFSHPGGSHAIMRAELSVREELLVKAEQHRATLGDEIEVAKTRITKLEMALLYLHSQVDFCNGRVGSNGNLCVLCHSGVYDGHGIVHEASCGMVKARQALTVEEAQ